MINYVKLNVDAGFRNGDAGYDFIIWDATDQLVLAGTGRLHSISSVLHADLMALWRSVENVLQWHQHNLIVETNCQVLVQQLFDGTVDLWPLEGIFERYRQFLDPLVDIVKV